MNRLLALADATFGRLARWPIIGLLVLSFLLINVVMFGAISRFEAAAGGLPILELPSVAPPSELGAVARAYPPEAAQIYRTVIQPLDVLFPLAAGLLFGNLIYLLVAAQLGAGSPWRALSLLGAAACLADYLENIGVFVLLRTAEAPPPGVELLIRVVSLVKFGVGIAAVVSIVALLASLLVRRVVRMRVARVQRPQ
ncbi:MAG: hypothetical protein OHK0022_43060 [Roseiflexaceae bacterium]